MSMLDFNYNGKLYDLEFDRESVCLYIITDKLSNTIFTRVVEAANDFVAAQAFLKFQNDMKEKNDLSVYELLKIGFMDFKTFDLHPDKYVLFDTRDDVAKFIDDAKDFILAWSEKEKEAE